METCHRTIDSKSSLTETGVASGAADQYPGPDCRASGREKNTQRQNDAALFSVHLHFKSEFPLVSSSLKMRGSGAFVSYSALAV